MLPSGEAMLPRLSSSAACAMWCEQMQDVSGFMAAAAQSPSSELAAFTRTTPPEYDIYTHDSGYPSPDELLWSEQDQSDPGVGEHNMYSEDNNSYRQQQVEIDDWLGISDADMEGIPAMAVVPRSPEAGVYYSQIRYENPLASNTSLEKPTKTSGSLSVFATEEPRIAETVFLDQVKPLTFELPSQVSEVSMDLGGEVEVTTEEESPTSSDDDFFKFEPKEELPDELVYPGDCSPEHRAHPKEEFSLEELVSPEQVFPLLSNSLFPMNSRSSPLRPVPVGLKLDIAAALAPINSAEPVPGLLNTPDLMTLLNTPDLLRPPMGFDLVDFIVVEGDANNNAIVLPSPTVEVGKNPAQWGKPRTLTELKTRRVADGRKKREWRKPPAEEPLPGPSRPARKSAEKFLQRLEEGLLAEEAEEDEGPRKRRRSNCSTLSRRRLVSDSDQSSVSSLREDADKYRLRRDRNNLSSRLSREKRKDRTKKKQQELRVLEEENSRLQRRSEALREACDRANFFWQQYVESVRHRAEHS